MELTVTIDSVMIPQRSVLDFAIDRPDSQYLLMGARLSIIDRNETFIVTQKFFEPVDEEYYALPMGYLSKGYYATIGFPYNALQAPYESYIEIRAYPQGDVIGCTADCSPIPIDLEWFNIGEARRWLPGTGNGTDWSFCPRPYCPGTIEGLTGRGAGIIVDKKYIVSQYYDKDANNVNIDDHTSYWWRSPLLWVSPSL